MEDKHSCIIVKTSCDTQKQNLMIKKLSDQSLGSQFELEGEIIALLPINAMD